MMMKRQMKERRKMLALACAFLVQLLPGPRLTVQAATIEAGDRESSAMSGPGAAHWAEDENGWWWNRGNGGYAKSEWMLINDKWYHFDERGYMQTGAINVDGVFYYLNEDGSMVSDETREVNGITYTFGSSGAGTAVWPYKMPLAVPPEEEKTEFHKMVDAEADRVLAGIINDDMSQWQKATAIYRWVKGHLRYSGYSPVGNWVSGAWDGFRKCHGDCYTYYATSAELLNRAGMQTIEVIRSTDNNHYWNLVNVDGNWYHFDPCPNRAGTDWCLVTDGQIAGNRAHIFNHALYPLTP